MNENFRQQSTAHRPARIAPLTGAQPTPVQVANAALLQLRRTMQLFCLLLVLLIAAPAWAGGFYLNDLGFGDRPLPEMICTAGRCLAAELPQGSLPIASYVLPRDWTHFEATPITTPHYDFLNNRLFRIRFRIDCRPATAEAALQHFWDSFKFNYPLSESPCPEGSKAAVCRRGTLDTGEVLSIAWAPHAGIDSRPLVQIFDPYLMDEARSLANPDYQRQY